MCSCASLDFGRVGAVAGGSITFAVKNTHPTALVGVSASVVRQRSSPPSGRQVRCFHITRAPDTDDLLEPAAEAQFTLEVISVPSLNAGGAVNLSCAVLVDAFVHPRAAEQSSGVRGWTRPHRVRYVLGASALVPATAYGTSARPYR